MIDVDLKDLELPVNYVELGPTAKRLIREEYVRRQEGKCCHCGMPLDGDPPPEIADLKINKRLFPATFFDHPIHLHHNHDTEMTIGAVHSQCNAVLWQYHGE